MSLSVDLLILGAAPYLHYCCVFLLSNVVQVLIDATLEKTLARLVSISTMCLLCSYYIVGLQVNIAACSRLYINHHISACKVRNYYVVLYKKIYFVSFFAYR